jgi:hypothetical protein
MVRSLQPRMNRQEAVRCFSPGGMRGAVAALRKGPLLRIGEAYVPFALYQVRVSNRGRESVRWLAMDAVSGLLDLYELDGVPKPSDVVELETRNRPAPALDEFCSGRLLEDKVRRIVFPLGFWRLSDFRITLDRMDELIYVPYWLGFFGRNEFASVEVIDARRGRLEGSKARAFFTAWLSGETSGESVRRNHNRKLG